MTRLGHGGDLLTFEKRYRRSAIDFSSNVNPCGMSPSARNAAMSALDVSDRYPDPMCRELVEAISVHENVPSEWIVCGNGASDIIYRIVYALTPKRALVCDPTFSEYADALMAVDCKILHHQLKESEDLMLTSRLADEIESGFHGELDFVFLCEPNNPTGLPAGKKTLNKIVEVCAKKGIVVLLDECFNSFLDYPERSTLMPFLGQYCNLVILGAHTKTYGMAGLRLGYMFCSNETITKAVAASGPAWPVSTVAQAAGVAAYDDQIYLERAREVVRAERPRIVEALVQAGCRVYPSQANYLLFEAPCENFGDLLAERGILVRSCDNYEGLTRRHFRCAVRLHDENDMLIEAIRYAVDRLSTKEGS